MCGQDLAVEVVGEDDHGEGGEQSPREPQLQGFYAERASQHRHSLGVGVLKVININYAPMKRGGIGCGRECRAVESSSLM